MHSSLNDHFEKHVRENNTELHIFSGECPGQNRKHTGVKYLPTLADTKKFGKILYYFTAHGKSVPLTGTLV
jgi:hypothetical protein